MPKNSNHFILGVITEFAKVGRASKYQMFAYYFPTPHFYTCDKQVLWESASFFPRDNSLISDRKSHNSDFFGLAVRCLCANFFTSFSKQKFLFFFDNMRLPPFGFLRLIFENFLMSPKGPPFIFLIFCNRTNVKKFQRVSSFRFFGTMRLLKIRIFFENFSIKTHSVVYMRLFQFFFHRSPLNFYQK